MAKVTMPQLGESVAEGTIGRWLKQPGDAVAKYEPLLEVITDKVNAEVPSPYAGILKEILAEEGAIVANNAEIAVIETDDEAGGTAPAGEVTPPAASVATEAQGSPAVEGTVEVEPAASQPSNGPAGSDERPAASAASGAPAPTTSAAAPVATAPGDADPNARMTPAVRRLLREHGLEASQIAGTGGGGRITREDVLKVVETIRTGGGACASTWRGSSRASTRRTG